MPDKENIKVAVRVRPFNKREKDRKAKLCVQMNGKVTTVTDPQTNKPKSFTYDYSYWSFDGGKENKSGYLEQDLSHANGKKYCDQKRVYEDVGKGIIKNAWAGYNATLFAYGQTGSGKSWSVIGYGPNKGIVPLLTEELFDGIKANTEEKAFEVRFSMLEIYSEVVRDLLGKNQQKSGLKMRQHPKRGFYAEGLRQVLVTSHEDIAAKMEEGTINRTIRSTNMNATSSRAHTIVCVTFVQKFKNERGQETAKTACINLVDLAGSERVDSTGATGDRLKEGAAINASLSALGNVINALVKQSKGESVRIPYRDSALTKLLKNALGGNSKTIMIAAISPADINFDETVSTLNFADRAKQIQTKAVVNEDPTEKLIRGLMEQNEKLKKELEQGKVDKDFIDEDGDGIDDRDAARLRARWEEEMRATCKVNDQELESMKKTYEEKLKNAQVDVVDPSIKKKEEERLRKPHIYNLNSDPMLSGKVVHILKAGKTTVGNKKGKESDITMIGPSIQREHAVFNVDKNGSVTLQNQNADNRTLVNGSQISGATKMQHNDRIGFGSTQIWVFQNPLQSNKSKMKFTEITYEFAQEEMAAKSGLNINNMASSGTDVTALQQDLLELMPGVEEANSVSEELDKKVKFEIVIVSPQVVGKPSGKPELQVKLKNLENGTEFHWSKEKFNERLFSIREMYNNYAEEEELEELEESDPFWESMDTEVHIGTAQLSLKPLAYMVEIIEQVSIHNLKCAEIGILAVEIIPTDRTAKKKGAEIDYSEPNDLIGRDVSLQLKIIKCTGISNRYTDIYCSYKFYNDNSELKTEVLKETSNLTFNYERKLSFRPVTKLLVDYLSDGILPIKVMGKQRLRGSAVPLNQGLTTRDILKNDRAVFSKTSALMNGFQMNGRIVDPQRQSLIVELLLMKKTQAKLQQRCDNVTKLIKEAENTSQVRVSTSLLREVMNAPNPEQADALIRKRLSDDSIFGGNGGGGHPKSSVCTIV